MTDHRWSTADDSFTLCRLLWCRTADWKIGITRGCLSKQRRDGPKLAMVGRVSSHTPHPEVEAPRNSPGSALGNGPH